MIIAAPKCPGMAAGAVSLRKSHDIIILSFCNIVKDQANCFTEMETQILSLLFYFCKVCTLHQNVWLETHSVFPKEKYNILLCKKIAYATSD